MKLALVFALYAYFVIAAGAELPPFALKLIVIVFLQPQGIERKVLKR